jgi:2-methylisocitrate lyase-like PEP mutase family enzyme
VQSQGQYNKSKIVNNLGFWLQVLRRSERPNKGASGAGLGTGAAVEKETLQMAPTTNGARLRAIIHEKRAVIVPGVANALAARVVEDLGFEIVFITGAGVNNTFYGIPDLGFAGLGEIAQHTSAISGSVNLPIIVDGDTGFGNAVNTFHTVKTLERAGANAIQLEDQAMPKRCGHFAGKEIVPVEEMAAKIRAATDARQSQDFLILARTDVLVRDGFEAAVERAQRFIEAGADLTFIEAVEAEKDLRSIPARLSVPQVLNIVVGGKTPVIDHKELSSLGYGMVLYANTALQGAIAGMKDALSVLKTSGRMDESGGKVAPFAERQRLVRKPEFDSLEKKYTVR